MSNKLFKEMTLKNTPEKLSRCNFKKKVAIFTDIISILTKDLK